MNPPFFSVVIPTCRRDELLGRAIDSLLAQSFADFELIVVDNAGTEATRSIVDSRADERIGFVVATARQGAAYARNRGLEIARGNWFCFVDDDDELSSEFLDSLHRLLTSIDARQVGFCWTAQKRVRNYPDRPASSTDYRVGASRVANRSFVLRIGAGGLCVSREAMQIIGEFDEALQVSEDRDLLLRLLEAGFEGVPLDRPLYIRHYDAGAQLSASLDPLEDARHDSMLLERHRDYIERYPALRDMLLDQLSKNYALGGDHARALEIAQRAFRLNPLRLKAIRRLLKCYLHDLGERFASSRHE